MAKSAVRRPKKLLEYDIDLDHDEQLHSSDDENIVLLHHGDLHANSHDNIFTEHHALTPTIEETHKILKKDKFVLHLVDSLTRICNASLSNANRCSTHSESAH